MLTSDLYPDPNVFANHQVISLIETIDSVMRAYDKSVYYEDPTPHMSVAWALWNPYKESDTTAAAAACAKQPSIKTTLTTTKTDDNYTMDGVSDVEEEQSDTERITRTKAVSPSSSVDVSLLKKRSSRSAKDKSSSSKIESKMKATTKVHAIAWKIVVRCGNREHDVSLIGK